MIIPMAHENLRGRRWPWVTIGIIALNFVIFVCTLGPMQADQARTGRVQLHILLLSAHYPDAHMTPEAAEMVSAFKRDHKAVYQYWASSNRDPVDGWDIDLRTHEWTASDVDAEMADLCSKFEQAKSESFMWKYAFHPFHPTPWSFVTATFLHGGWLHIIFNMWFLWLAGTILEETWGRIVYPIFYLVCGVLAFLVHAAVYPDSFIPVVGASGAIAGLMGGFLARFPQTKIKMMWWFFFFRVYFNVRAYIVLPLWLVIQVFWGTLFAWAGAEGGVAYWAHIGGFAFGMIGAVVLRSTGIEQAAEKAIEAKVTWSADPCIVRATDFLGDNQPDAAIEEMKQLLKDQPDSIEGNELLLKAQEKKQDFEAAKETLAILCRLYVTSGDLPMAWNYYEQFSNLGGDKLPRGVWLELCRFLEGEQNWDRAVLEYERLAEKNPTERVSVSALVSAARICLTKLNRTSEAKRLYEAAEASTVPHLDLEVVIQEGLKKCIAAIPTLDTYAR